MIKDCDRFNKKKQMFILEEIPQRVQMLPTMIISVSGYQDFIDIVEKLVKYGAYLNSYKSNNQNSSDYFFAPYNVQKNYPKFVCVKNEDFGPCMYRYNNPEDFLKTFSKGGYNLWKNELKYSRKDHIDLCYLNSRQLDNLALSNSKMFNPFDQFYPSSEDRLPHCPYVKKWGDFKYFDYCDEYKSKIIVKRVKNRFDFFQNEKTFDTWIKPYNKDFIKQPMNKKKIPKILNVQYSKLWLSEQQYIQEQVKKLPSDSLAIAIIERFNKRFAVSTLHPDNKLYYTTFRKSN